MSDKLSNLMEFLKSKGIDSPENPDQNQMKDIIGLYLQNEMATEQFKSYMQFADPAVSSVIKGLNECVASNKNISGKVIELIQTTIVLFDEQIKTADTLEERREIRKDIEKLIIQAREEAGRNAEDTKELYLIGAGVVAVLAGIGIAALTKDSAVLKSGLKMVADGTKKVK